MIMWKFSREIGAGLYTVLVFQVRLCCAQFTHNTFFVGRLIIFIEISWMTVLCMNESRLDCDVLFGEGEGGSGMPT